MNLFNIITHLSTIVDCAKTVESVVQACVKEKRAPSKAEIKSVIDCGKQLYDAGLFPLPVPQAEVDAGFDAIEKALS